MSDAALETIVLIQDYARLIGGAPKVAMDSAKGLAGRGHRVIYFAATGPADPSLSENGVEVICLGQPDLLDEPSRLRAMARGIWNRRAAAELTALLATLDPASTVIHSHGWYNALSPSIGKVLINAGFPLVWTMHEYFFGCPNGGLYNFQTREICQLKGLSGACIKTHCDARSYAHKLWRVARLSAAHRIGLPGSLSHIIYLSETQQRAIGPYLNPKTKLFQVNNPIPIDKRPRVEVENNRNVTFGGRINPEKGCDVLAKAMKGIDLTCVLVGDGAARAEVAAINPNVQITGWVSSTEMEAHIGNARLLAFPSLWYEAQPLMIYEALARGVPVASSDRSAGADAVKDGRNGLLFPIGNPDAMHQALIRCQDDGFVQQLSKNAYDDYWSSPLTVDAHLDRLLEVYGEVAFDHRGKKTTG